VEQEENHEKGQRWSWARKQKGNVKFDQMNPIILIILNLVALWFLIKAIYTSQRRWLSFGYAVLGFVITIVLGIILTFILMTILGPKSAPAVNSVLDPVGNGIQLAGPFAAVLGANMPPRRKKQG